MTKTVCSAELVDVLIMTRKLALKMWLTIYGFWPAYMG